MIVVREFTLSGAPFADATGRGVRIAVVDSGVHAAHPHVGGIAGGIHLTDHGDDDDVADRLGHGTAVAAAIRDKAPAAGLLAVRVFDDALVTSADRLARAIEWSAAAGASLINLSLGTGNPAHAERLSQAVAVAASLDAVVVAAREAGDRPLLPGTLEGVVGVLEQRDLPRDALRVVQLTDGRPALCAAPWPRPIPGVPPERNLHGISFAVANATGFLARLLEREPGLRRVAALHQWVRTAGLEAGTPAPPAS